GLRRWHQAAAGPRQGTELRESAIDARHGGGRSRRRRHRGHRLDRPCDGGSGPMTTPSQQPSKKPEPDPFGPEIEEQAQQLAARYPQARSALLPMLHLVQSVQGYVSQEGIAFCARQLDLTEAEVSAVATFYTMYKRKPCGEHLVSVCTNTLCAALGGDEIYKRLSEHLGEDGKPLGHEETVGEPGEPGSITLEHAECLAACDFGPVLQVNYEYFDNQTPEKAVELV